MTKGGKRKAESQGKTDHLFEVRYRAEGWQGDDPEGGGGSAWDFSVLHIKTGEKNYYTAGKGNT